MWKIMFLGQKPIGEQCFELLLKGQNSNYSIEVAVANKYSTNVWWHGNRIFEICKKKNIFFVDNVQKNEDILKKLIIDKKINFIVSVGHNWILSDEILQLVDYQAVNLHLAKLPDYKGNYTYNHAILNQEKTYGVTFHWMAAKVDAGDYIFVKEFPIEDDDTAYSLYIKSIDEGLGLFARFIEYINANERLPRVKMEGDGCFYSRKSLDGLREVHDCDDLKAISRKSRAFYFPPFENAYFYIDGKKYYICPKME